MVVAVNANIWMVGMIDKVEVWDQNAPFEDRTPGQTYVSLYLLPFNIQPTKYFSTCNQTTSEEDRAQIKEHNASGLPHGTKSITKFHLGPIPPNQSNCTLLAAIICLAIS